MSRNKLCFPSIWTVTPSEDCMFLTLTDLLVTGLSPVDIRGLIIKQVFWVQLTINQYWFEWWRDLWCPGDIIHLDYHSVRRLHVSDIDWFACDRFIPCGHQRVNHKTSFLGPADNKSVLIWVMERSLMPWGHYPSGLSLRQKTACFWHWLICLWQVYPLGTSGG